MAALFALAYDAEFVLWNPIAQRTDPTDLLPETPAIQRLAELRYSDGSPVLKDRQLTGAKIMRDILIELDKIDEVAFRELAYDSWSETNQKSPKNDRYIYRGVMDVLRRYGVPVGPFDVHEASAAPQSNGESNGAPTPELQASH